MKLNSKSVIIFPTAILVAIMLGAIPLTGLTIAVAQEISGSYRPVQPDSNGICPEGTFSTSIGCCPNGTENVHDICESPSQHQEGTNAYLKCLIAHGAQDILNQNPGIHIQECANQG